MNQGTTEDCHLFAVDMATKVTKIPLAFFTHAIVKRVILHTSHSVLEPHVFHKTTLELFESISVLMVKAELEHDLYVGDRNVCELFCRKCHQQFGVQGTIFCELTEATLHCYITMD